MSIANVEVLILAGGLGTRLAQVVDDVPKPMALVAGRPFLEILIEKLGKNGLEQIRLLVGHKRETIMEHFLDGKKFGREISYTVEESPLGTGGALRKAVDESKSEQFLILNGDTYFDISFQSFLEQSGEKDTIALVEMSDVSRYGSVEVDQNQMIVSFKEKGQSSGPALINAGIYHFRRQTIEKFSSEKHSLEDIDLPQLVASRQLSGVQLEGKFIDIGVPQDYFFAQEYLSEYRRNP